MSEKRSRVAAAIDSCKNVPSALGTRSKQFGAGVSSAYSVSSVPTKVEELRESAIEPLPRIERMPLTLRKLEWEGKPPGTVDAAAIVRRLRGATANQDEQNELGCAYALLAWQCSVDDYWRSAISELRAACRGDDDEARKRATANLERVAEVSGFAVES